MPNKLIGLKIVRAVPASILVFTLMLVVVAQSGRRANKSTQVAKPSVPVSPADAGAIAKSSPTPEKPRVALTIGMEDAHGFSRVSLSGQSAALQGCVDRLNESASVKVGAVNRNMSRGEAIKKAKSGDAAHVIWLRVELDRMSADVSGNADIRDVFVEYVLFAPTTAKVVGSGRTYPYRRNRSVIPTGRTGGLYGDYEYLQAGREVAEKILSSLSLPTRPVIIR